MGSKSTGSKSTGNSSQGKPKFKAFERKLVKDLEKYINRNYSKIYTEIDQDSKGRLFKSGYDILFSYAGRVIFAEAKHVKKAPKDLEGAIKLLRPYQKLTRFKSLSAGCPYWIIIFCGYEGDEIALFDSVYPNRLYYDLDMLLDKLCEDLDYEK